MPTRRSSLNMCGRGGWELIMREPTPTTKVSVRTVPSHSLLRPPPYCVLSTSILQHHQHSSPTITITTTTQYTFTKDTIEYSNKSQRNHQVHNNTILSSAHCTYVPPMRHHYSYTSSRNIATPPSPSTPLQRSSSTFYSLLTIQYTFQPTFNRFSQ